MLDVFRPSRVLSLALIALASAATNAVRADYAFIAYYHTPGAEISQLTINSNNTVTSAAIFGNTNTFNNGAGFQGEGITFEKNMPGANSTQIYIVSPDDGTVKSFDPSGNMISNNILKTSSGATLTLGGGCAGSTLSADGQTLYVAQSGPGGTGEGIYAFNAVSGKEIGYVAMDQAHDVTFHNGYVYASAYQSSINGGVYRFNADLSGETQIITPNSTNNLYHATGMTFIGNNLYVGNAGVNSSTNVANFVQEYTVSGTSATLQNTFTSSTMIINPFGVATGPDGNIYISSLGDLGSTNGQITELNVSTNTLSTWVANGTVNTGNAPKYLSFQSEAVSFVPEPGSNILMGLGLAGIALGRRVWNRKTAVA